MDIFKPNLDSSIDQVAQGIYLATLASATPVTNKSGVKCVRIENRISEGPYKNKVVPVILPLEGKAAGFFKSFVLAVKPDYDGGEISTDDLIGKTLKIKVLKSTYPNGARSYLKITAFPASYNESPSVAQSQEEVRHEM